MSPEVKKETLQFNLFPQLTMHQLWLSNVANNTLSMANAIRQRPSLGYIGGPGFDLNNTNYHKGTFNSTVVQQPNQYHSRQQYTVPFHNFNPSFWPRQLNPFAQSSNFPFSGQNQNRSRNFNGSRPQCQLCRKMGYYIGTC